MSDDERKGTASLEVAHTIATSMAVNKEIIRRLDAYNKQRILKMIAQRMEAQAKRPNQRR
jgi:flagellar biosynthesis/type III secretory pathway protein FliH